MTAQTQFLDLDFNRYSPAFEFIDKKAGIKAALGLIGKLPRRMEPVVEKYDSLLLSIQDTGMGQDILDHTCLRLQEDCSRHDIEIIVSKSTRPFDKQWYVFGDLRGLLQAMNSQRIKLPFGTFLYEDLYTALERLKTK